MRAPQTENRLLASLYVPESTMFERFTDRARQIIGLASGEAAQRAGDPVDTVDILVGMLREGKGIAGHVLRCYFIEVDAVLRARDTVCDVPDVTLADVESTSRIEAAWLGHNYPGTEHLLLAVCCLGKSRGARLIAGLGHHPVQLCSFVFDILGPADEWERWLVDHPDVAHGRDRGPFDIM
jgi:ATP-dependent Clp protease ATP-binding subunit ClpC